MPCSCVTYIPPVLPPNNPDCFRLGTMLLDQCNNAGPCGDTATIPFTCFNINCTGTLSFSVYSISDPTKIIVNSIGAGGLTYTTTNNAYPNDRIEIVVYGVCDNGPCDILSDYGTIVIYIKDKCKGVVCPASWSCDYCTGLCQPQLLNLNINSNT